ncbi:MAG: hypothetical protein WCD88_15805, partial [Desulfobacterales bacterium]
TYTAAGHPLRPAVQREKDHLWGDIHYCHSMMPTVKIKEFQQKIAGWPIFVEHFQNCVCKDFKLDTILY